MEWTPDSGEVVTWDWSATPPADDQTEVEPYAVKIRIDGRRLRGDEAQDWKRRIAAEFTHG